MKNKFKISLFTISSVLTLLGISSPVFAATYSQNFNFTNVSEYSRSDISVNGSSGDFSWGGTFNNSYQCDLLNSDGQIMYQWDEPSGTMSALNNENTISAGTYTLTFTPLYGGTLSGNGTIYWD